MSSSISTPVFCVCVILNVCLGRLIAQSTTDQHQSDEGTGRQVVLMEQMISMMESINDRQMELVKQIHSTLSSVDRRMEESKFVDDRQVALMEQMQSTLRSVDRKMEEIYYVGDRQVALLRSIERRTEEANEGLHCLPRSSGKRTCYKFVEIEMNRTDARTYCQNLGDGVDLISVESQQENNFLYTVMKGLQSRRYHTSGQQKSGVWQWTATGQPFNYTAWPDYNYYYGDFCYIYLRSDGVIGWTERYDSAEYFICEYPLCG